MIALLLAATAGHAQVRNLNADVTPIVGSDGVPADATVRTALQIRLADGLHANSNKPRDPLLIPMVLSVEPPAGVSVVEIVYPPPTDLKQELSEQPLSVFEREFAIGVRLNVAREVAPGNIEIPAQLRYQACDEKMCYKPVTVETSWMFRVVPAGTPVNPLHGDTLDRIAFGHGEAAAAAPFVLPRALRSPPPAVGGDVLANLGAFTIAGRTAGYMGSSDFLEFVHKAETGVLEQGWFDNRGPLAILLIVLVGGLALNLTPCVLPMIPINLAIIGAGAQAGSRGRGFLLGAAYGAAMAFVYGVLGLVVILTAGTFGTINASPWFNAGIAALFVVLALAMFDVIVIDFSRFGSRFQVAETGPRDVPRRVCHGRHCGTAGRRLRRSSCHPGRAVLEQPVRERHGGSPGTPLPPWRRDGDSLAIRRRRHRRAPSAGRMDGSRQTAVRRRHSGDGRILRL